MSKKKSAGDEPLAQLKKTLGTVWIEPDEENPAIKLIGCESNVGGRINSFANGNWVQRRVSEDTLVILVELQDGTKSKLQFRRGLLDSGWKRVPPT